MAARAGKDRTTGNQTDTTIHIFNPAAIRVLRHLLAKEIGHRTAGLQFTGRFAFLGGSQKVERLECPRAQVALPSRERVLGRLLLGRLDAQPPDFESAVKMVFAKNSEKKISYGRLKVQPNIRRQMILSEAGVN